MSGNPIKKGTGFTDAERYLRHLCESSFLSMWSYPSVFRDQGGSVGKEVCDLLVVFGDDVLIFADKQCIFPRSGNLQLDWSRWFKRAVLGNVRQVFGAERWIRSFPNRLFLDPACTQPFPIHIPESRTARFHRIVVAHGVSDRCREELGGSGGLQLVPEIIGEDHYIDKGKGVRPFAIGTIDQNNRFVHVLDDDALETTMRALDTITDFLAYLRRKEDFVGSTALSLAASEREVLAYYLNHVNDRGEHYFSIPQDASLALLEGLWTQLCNDLTWKAEISRNRVSYFWDNVIERFSIHALAGTEYISSGFSGAEAVLHLMAREGRGRRRRLSLALGQFLTTSKHTAYAARVVAASTSEEPYYVFVHAAKPEDSTVDEYRRLRINMLMAYCMVVKYSNQDARHVVGIATCADSRQNCSEDALALDCSKWGETQNEEARQLQTELGILTKAKEVRASEDDLLGGVMPAFQRAKPHHG